MGSMDKTRGGVDGFGKGEFIEDDVPEDHTILQIKELIEGKTSIAPENQRLVKKEVDLFDGKYNENQLKDGQILSSLTWNSTQKEKDNVFYLVVVESRRRLTNQSLID